MEIAGLVETLAVQTVDDEGRYGPPLLQMLREARFASTGGTTGGATAANTRIQLNLDAHLLWEDLTGRIAAEFVAATEFRPNRYPEVNLLAWAAVLAAADERAELTPLQVSVATQKLEAWATRIRSLLDPPPTRELTIACPECGVDRVRTGEGELEVEGSAIVVTFPEDVEVVAECRNCHQTWEGNVLVIQLGRLAGLVIDPEKVRESMMPAPVPAPVEDDGIEDLDPSKPEHAVLLAAAPE